MKVFIAFLLAMFVAGGTHLGDRLLRRPAILLGVCTVVGATFYSLRVIQ